MPTRDIKESCRTSLTLARVSHGAERLFWRLLTYADDYGRFPAHAGVLRGQCFSVMLDAVREKDILVWVSELEAADLVRLYKDDEGKTFGFFPTWMRHQRVRAKQSKYPAPTHASICPPMLADADKCSGSTVVPVVAVDTDRTRVEPSASAPASTPTQAIAFEIPESVQAALARAPILGAVPRLRQPTWWQAQVRANGRRGIDFAAELLKAEAWLTTNRHRAPKKDHARFVHNWLARAEGPQ